MRLSHNSLVVVADGRKALFFRNEGDNEHPNLKVMEASEQSNPAHREQATDLAGQQSSPQGDGRGAYQTVDYHQQQEDRFAADTADRLKSGALANEYDHLVIVAPPRTLGELRKHYHGEVERRIAGEIAKDLTGHPVDQIEKIIVAAE